MELSRFVSRYLARWLGVPDPLVSWRRVPRKPWADDWITPRPRPVGHGRYNLFFSEHGQSWGNPPSRVGLTIVGMCMCAGTLTVAPNSVDPLEIRPVARRTVDHRNRAGAGG